MQDLDDAFEHLIANNGRWTDSHTSNYGGPGKIFKPANMILEAPTAAVNFLNSVDDKMKTLREAIAQFNNQAQQVAQAQQANDWAKASKALKGIKDYGGKAKYLLWWAPKSKMVVERASSFAGILGEFTSALDLYERGFAQGSVRLAGGPQDGHAVRSRPGQHVWTDRGWDSRPGRVVQESERGVFPAHRPGFARLSARVGTRLRAGTSLKNGSPPDTHPRPTDLRL